MMCLSCLNDYQLISRSSSPTSTAHHKLGYSLVFMEVCFCELVFGGGRDHHFVAKDIEGADSFGQIEAEHLVTKKIGGVVS
jgi:hypothetical protein